MLSSIRIRQFVPNDLQRVEEIENEWPKYLTPISLLSRYYEIPEGGFLVAEIDGRIIGYVVANVEREVDGHILAIAVDPKYKKRGAGAVLMNAITDFLKERGTKRLRVELKLYNKDAKNFYLALGFKESHIAKGYYRMRGYTEDALIMLKSI